MPVRAWLVQRWWLVLGLLLLGVVPRLVWLDQMWGADFDLGIYHNLVWNIAEGRGFWSDVLARNHLGEHASPLVALFAPLYLIAPSAAWLVAAQGVAVAVIAAAALWFAEAKGLVGWRWWAMLGLTVGYAPLWAAWWFDPQPVLYGAAGLAVALVALERRRWWALWLGLAVLLASRESAPLAGLGLAWWAWRKAASPRAALAIAVISLAWLAVAMLWLMPTMRAGAEWAHTSRLDPLAEPGWKALYLARLLGQLALLPLFDPVAALAALPAVLLNLSTGYWPQLSSAYHYDAQIAPFLLFAAAGGLAAGRWPLVAGRWLPVVLVLAAVAWASTPVRAIASLCQPERIRNVAATRTELAEVLAAIPPDAPLAADPQLGPLVCLRQGYRPLRGPREENPAQFVAALPAGTYVIVQRWWWQAMVSEPPPGLELRHDGRVLLVLLKR